MKLDIKIYEDNSSSGELRQDDPSCYEMHLHIESDDQKRYVWIDVLANTISFDGAKFGIYTERFVGLCSALIRAKRFVESKNDLLEHAHLQHEKTAYPLEFPTNLDSKLDCINISNINSNRNVNVTVINGEVISSNADCTVNVSEDGLDVNVTGNGNWTLHNLYRSK